MYYRHGMNIEIIQGKNGPVIEKPTYPLRERDHKPKTSMLTCHFCRCVFAKNSGHTSSCVVALIRTGDWSRQYSKAQSSKSS